jgi:prepilin-type N-terminal cleavage/methylation domain-containing protein
MLIYDEQLGVRVLAIHSLRLLSAARFLWSLMMESCPRMQQKGFTLIEGIMAVALISVVIGMAILGFRGLLQNAKANSGMDQVLSQLRSARERAIAHRCQVLVSFAGNNQLTLTEVWFKGVAPPPLTLTFEGNAIYTVFPNLPDVPAPYNFGNLAPIYIGGISGGPPVMQFNSTGAFVDGGNTFLNGTIFLGIPGNSSTARAITILGATGRVREYHWNGAAWQE